MTALFDSLKSETFLPLPGSGPTGGLTGVEIEFGGLVEQEAARILQKVLGGRIGEKSAHKITLHDSAIGAVQLELDTVYRKGETGPLKEAALELARVVVPLEIVTAPLPRTDLPLLEKARAALRDAGAIGTRDGALLGFGVHLNPEVSKLEYPEIQLVLLAYGLLEDWMRDDAEIDASRRLLPFVDRYPEAFMDALTSPDAPATLDAVIDTYLQHNANRNRGLDCLPLFRHLDEARVVAALGESAAQSVSARPTWHYRLPDCRIDEADWRLAHVWNRWRLVECVARDTALLDRLCAAWRDHRAQTFDRRSNWSNTVDAMLADVPDPMVIK